MEGDFGLEKRMVDESCRLSHEHFPIDIIDEVFNIDVDEMFQLLFTDSDLLKEFTRQRQTYDIQLMDWPAEADSQGIKTRVIRYTLSINYAIGPKSSPSVETQRLLAESRVGSHYVVDADCVNGGVPYGDNFYTTVRYCWSRLSPSSSTVVQDGGETRVAMSQTLLRITGKVVYKKHMWGFIKGFIEKTADSGLKNSFGVMADLLRAESNRQGPAPSHPPLSSSPRPPPRRRERKTPRGSSPRHRRLFDHNNNSNNNYNSDNVFNFARTDSDNNISARRTDSDSYVVVPGRLARRRRRHGTGGSGADPLFGGRTKEQPVHTSPVIHSTTAEPSNQYNDMTDILAKALLVIVLLLSVFHLLIYVQIAALEESLSADITRPSSA